MVETIVVPSFNYDNPNQAPRLVKVIVNIGVGEGGEKLQKAERVMEMITGKKPQRTQSKVTNRDWNLRQGAPIGCRVTLRGEDAEAFLRKALDIRQFKIPDYSFDDYGNLNFGISDYTDFPGMRYDPEIGIFGMDIAVVLERAGGRVKRRRIMPRKLPAHQRLKREEGMYFMQKNYNVEVI
ncbi:MAG TPA: 50S ribosomal protein L5 [Candidatus Thermoplasmatota archaeon]|nr:50S ribosomal protein L5 [Candidatus Thermoplasmatota archaeon]